MEHETQTKPRPTSASWTRLADAASYERHDLGFLKRCLTDLFWRTRDMTPFNTRAWIYARVKAFKAAECERLDAAIHEAETARNY